MYGDAVLLTTVTFSVVTVMCIVMQFCDNSNIQCCNCYVYGGAVLLTTVTFSAVTYVYGGAVLLTTVTFSAVTVMCMVVLFC